MKNQLRLLHVCESRSRQATAECLVCRMAARFHERGHAQGLLYQIPGAAEPGGWPVAWGPVFPWARGQFGRNLATVLGGFGPDIVIAHDVVHVPVLRRLVQAHTPLVGMMFDVKPLGERRMPWIQGWRWKLATRWLRQFQRLVVSTHFLKEQLLLGGLDAQRISVHLPAPPPPQPVSRGTFGSRNLILYVGPIQRHSGVSVLLESLALIRTPFECVFVGDGSYRPFCERLSRRMGLAHRVQFLPGLPEDGLARLFTEGTLVAVSSLQPEPLAPVGLQAMHHGLPVVAFDQGGIRDWLSDGDNGYLVPSGNRPVFAARMERLLKDKTLAQHLGEHGQRRLQREFSFERFLDDVERIWRHTLEEINANLSGASLPRRAQWLKP